MGRRILQMLMFGVAFLAACGGPGSGPEPLPLDRVNCAKCSMLISTAANAGQALVPGEETRFYDDIGCLAADAAATTQGARRFVQLANGAGWASVDAVWFAVSPDASTPMAYGFAAFSAEAEARRADTKGLAWRWEEISLRAGAR